MLRDVRIELQRVRERLAEYRRLREQAAALQREVQRLEQEVAALAARLARAELQVARLEGPGLAALWHRLLGDRNARLHRAREALQTVRLHHQKETRRLAGLQSELARVQAALAQLPDPTPEHQRLLAEMERLLIALGHPVGAQLGDLSAREAQLEAEARELAQAAAAGEAAAAQVQELLAAIRSAQGWGIFDLLGGGLLATAGKHAHLDRARRLAAEAAERLAAFYREAAEVRALTGTLDVGPLAHFADYFLDGLLADWVVQSRIDAALRQAQDAAGAVDAALRLVSARLDAVRRELEQVRAQKQALLEALA